MAIFNSYVSHYQRVSFWSTEIPPGPTVSLLPCPSGLKTTRRGHQMIHRSWVIGRRLQRCSRQWHPRQFRHNWKIWKIWKLKSLYQYDETITCGRDLHEMDSRPITCSQFQCIGCAIENVVYVKPPQCFCQESQMLSNKCIKGMAIAAPITKWQRRL